MAEKGAGSAQADAGAPNEKHPLQFKWTLWHDPPKNKSTSGKNWADNLRPIASFETVEDFWALFNNLQEPSQLAAGSSYNLFKDGIEPKWEDKANTNGGQWRVQVPATRKELLDSYWVNTLLTTIGEGFSPDDSDDIAGIVINLRRGGDRVSIWTKSAVNQELQESIGITWKQSLLNEGARLEYITFKDQMGGGRNTRPRYTVG